MIEEIKVKIHSAYDPVHLEVSDQSSLHQGHLEDGPEGESHIKVVLVSPLFEGMPAVSRHRHVHNLLKYEISRIHAVQLNLIAPSEWIRIS